MLELWDLFLLLSIHSENEFLHVRLKIDYALIYDV